MLRALRVRACAQVEEVQLALEQLSQVKAAALMEVHEAQQASQEALAFTNEKFAAAQVRGVLGPWNQSWLCISSRPKAEVCLRAFDGLQAAGPKQRFACVRLMGFKQPAQSRGLPACVS